MPDVDYSIVIPAYNEEEELRQTLEYVVSSMESVSFRGELIVVDNNSTDATPDIAKEFDAQVVFEKMNAISRARNAGGRVARGRYLLFLDADTRLTPGLLQGALEILESGAYCCGGGYPQYVERGSRFAETLISIFNWMAKKWGIAAGCFVFCLKEGFDTVGGFNEKIYFSEEIWFVRAVKKWGRKEGLLFHLIEDERVLTSSRKLDYPWAMFFTFTLTILVPFAPYLKFLGGFWYRRQPRKTHHY